MRRDQTLILDVKTVSRIGRQNVTQKRKRHRGEGTNHYRL